MATTRMMLGMVALVALFAANEAEAADCKPAHTFPTVAAGKLMVAIYEYPPFTMALPDGKMGGVDSAIASRFAELNCLAVTPAIVDPAATIQYVLAGKADIAAGDWYRTAERAKVLGISYPIYLDQMGIYSKTGVDTIEAMVGKNVGTVSGFLWVTELQKLLGAKLHLYPNPVALAQDLEAGRIDIGADSYATGVFAQAKGGYPGIKILVAKPDQRVQASIEPSQAGLLYTKGNTAMGEALDDAIMQMHKDGSIAKFLSDAGLNPSGADVGAPRLVK